MDRSKQNLNNRHKRKGKKVFSLPLGRKSVSNQVLLFLKVVFLTSFLLMTDCSYFTVDENVINHESKNPTVTPSYKELDATPLNTKDARSMDFYVSITGNNTDGKSWDTAWNELDQIRWEEINPGDRVVIDGGEYHTPINVKKSGAPGLPITITTNGKQVVLDGQRLALPYCGQANYISVPGEDAINLEDQSFIVIDGQRWSGIVIKNHLRGIKMREQTNNIIVRNVEIYNNGYSTDLKTNVAPDGPGVRLGGSDILFERAIIHDNGQDAFQVGWGVWDFTLRDSWLYNSREHPIVRGESFNYCSHTDGLQIYGGGRQGPVVIEDSIIGPSFTQGIIIDSAVTVDHVVIRNTLFLGSDNAGIIISDGGRSSNWILQNITIVQDAKKRSWSLKLNGSNHQIRDSLFAGGPWGIGVFNPSEAIGNFNWRTPDRYDIAVESDPMFVDDDYNRFNGEGFADFDFTIQNPLLPPGKGSSITSLPKLFAQ